MGKFLDAISDEAPERKFLMAATSEPEPAGTVGLSDPEEFRKTDRGVNLKVGAGMMKFGKGIKQVALQGLEALGVVPEGTTLEFTRLTDEERATFDDAFREEFGDRFVFDLAEFIGEAAPIMAVPQAGAATTAGRLAVGAVAGGAVGGAQFVPEGGSRGANAATGAITGAGVNAVVGKLADLKRFLGRTLGSRFSRPTPEETLSGDIVSRASASGKEFAARGVALSERTGVPLTLQQITDDPVAEMATEIATKGIKGARVDRYIKTEQIKQGRKLWGKIIERLKPDDKDFAKSVRGSFEKIIGDSGQGTGLLGARSRQATQDFRALDTLTGDKAVIPIDDFMASIDDLIKQGKRRSASPQIERLAARLGQFQKRFTDGLASGQEMQDLLASFGRASKGTGRLFRDIESANERRVATQLFGALRQDLESAATNPGLGEEVAKALRTARTNYAVNSLAIKEVENSALGRLFGVPEGKISDDLIRDRFLKMSADDLVETTSVLSRADPDMLQRLQVFYLRGKVAQATQPGPANVEGFSPGRMLELVKDAEKFDALFPDTKARGMVQDGLEVMQRLMIDQSRRAASGGLPRIKLELGAMASSDPGMVMRILTEVFAPNQLIKATLTPEGVAALRAAANVSPRAGSARIAAIVGNLAASIELVPEFSQSNE